MNIYAEILKSPEQKRQEEIALQERQKRDIIAAATRLDWVNRLDTQEYVKHLESEISERYYTLLNSAVDVDMSDINVRRYLIELAVLTKTLNHIKYGKFSITVTDGTSTSTGNSGIINGISAK